MSEKDRKEFREKKGQLLMEGFLSQAKLDSLKPEFYENIKNGMGLYIYASVDSVKKCLKKSGLDATVKLRALLFLKEAMDIKQKPMSQYVQTKILVRLKEIAKLVKKPNDKKKLFSKDSKQQTIDDFFQLLLECLNEWQVMFPIEPGTQCDPSQFKKVWSELLAIGIRCPEKKMFFKARSDSIPPSKDPKPAQKQPTQQTPVKPVPVPELKTQQTQKTAPPPQQQQAPPPKKAVNHEIAIQARELREGSINYFHILLELLADSENAQMIIEMTPEFQSLISPLTEQFIEQLVGIPDVPEQVVEDVFQIKQIAEDIILDIGKIGKKPTLYPQFQKKYTSTLTKFLKAVEANEKAANQKPEKQAAPVFEPPERQPAVFQPQFPEPPKQQDPAWQPQFETQWQPAQPEQDFPVQPLPQTQFGNPFQQQFNDPNLQAGNPFEKNFEQPQQGFYDQPYQHEQPAQFQAQWQPEQVDQDFTTSQFQNFGNPFGVPSHEDDGNPFERQLPPEQLPQGTRMKPQQEVRFAQDFGDQQFGRPTIKRDEDHWRQPEPRYEHDHTPSIEQQQPAQHTESFPQFEPEQDFQFQYAASKDQSATPQASQIRSAGQPFSNIFEIEKHDTEKRGRGDSISEMGNISQIPQDKNFGFDDFALQDFNIQIGASVSSQKQISQQEKQNQTRGSADSPNHQSAFNFFAEPVYKSKKSASVLDFTQNNEVPEQADHRSVDDFDHKVAELVFPQKPPSKVDFSNWEFEPQPGQTPQDFTNWGAQPPAAWPAARINSYDSLPPGSMVELPVHQPNVERIPTRDSSRSLAQQPTQQGNDSKVERIPSSKKLPITPEDIRPVVKVIKPETKDVLVQVDVSEREDNEYEIKVICKQDPEQERRHQEESTRLKSEIISLRHQKQSDQQEVLNLRKELAAALKNESFLKTKHQQTLEQSQKMLSSFATASDNLNKARISIKLLNSQLAQAETENRDLRDQVTEYIQSNQTLSEEHCQVNSKYNNLLRSMHQLQNMRCQCHTCSVTQYLAQITSHSTHQPKEPQVTPPTVAKPKPSLPALIKKKTIDPDYAMFIKVCRIQQEPLASQVEPLKYASLVNRAVLFENATLQVGIITRCQGESNDLHVTLNLYNKSPSAIQIEQSTILCPSKNLVDPPSSINSSVKSKQSLKYTARFTYVEQMEVPLFAVQINQQIYKIVLPVVIPKFCTFQQCDQQYWMQSWKTMKDGSSTIQQAVLKPSPRLLSGLTDLKRYWNDVVEIRPTKSKPNWLGYGLLGKVNQMFEFAIKFVHYKGVTRIKVQAHPSLEAQMADLLQTLHFVLSQ